MEIATKKTPSFKEGFFVSQSSICMLVVASALCRVFSSSHLQYMYAVLSNLSDVCTVELGYSIGLSDTFPLVSDILWYHLIPYLIEHILLCYG